MLLPGTRDPFSGEMLDGEQNSAPTVHLEKLASLVKGGLYVALASDSYKV